MDVSNFTFLARGSVVAGLLLFVACSSESASDEDGDDDDANGGSAASGSGAGGASGASTGGRIGTGGTAPTGGAGASGVGGTGTGGSSAGTLAVRCFDYGEGQRLCYATPGTDNWAVAWKRCAIEPAKNDPAYEVVGGPAAVSCEGLPGLPDDPSGWDEVFCLRHISSGFVLCFGRIGEYWLEIFPDCSWADLGYPRFPGDPAALFCGAPSVANGGWDELSCFNPGGDAVDRCWGRRGAYWAGPSSVGLYLNGLTPTCSLDDGGTAVEISPNDVPCPATGSGGTGAAGGSGGSSGGAAAGSGGAAAGSSGAAGSTGGANPSGCPATQPIVGASCVPTAGSHCVYGSMQCECNAQGMFGCIACPATVPVVGTGCVQSSPQVNVLCYFAGGRACECRRDTSQWSCP